MLNKFEQIYVELKKQILDGNLAPGCKLASENKLCAQYSASRGTVRKALELLAQDGLVNAVHGKGVYVLEHGQITLSFGNLVSFAEASQETKCKFTTEVIYTRDLCVDEAIQQQTSFGVGEPLLKILRIRKHGGENIIADVNYFSQDLIPGLNKSHAEQSIYHYIERILQLKIGFARRTIQVCQPSQEDCQYLGLSANANVVVVKNWVYLTNNQLFEYTESHHRPERFIFSEFVRRR